MKIATVMIVRPKKEGDPTEHTFSWADKAYEIAEDMGYNVIDIQKDQTSYQNVTAMIRKYKPALFSAWSHGCPNSLVGQNECMVTRKFEPGELMQMMDTNPEKIEVVRKMMNPLGSISCPGICKIDNICNPLCTNPTNVGELKGTIIYATACYSALQLGHCGIKYGVKSYIGFKDLYMFPVDTIGSQDIFGDVQLSFYKSLLLGRTVGEAEQDMIKLEDSYIKKYKTTKYISLPLLWNKINRGVLGDKNAMIYQ